MKPFCLALAMVTLFTGCATRTHYSWGHYEELVYLSYAKPGKIPPEEQIARLDEDFQKARSKNQPVPPGFHAYAGYLYTQLGKLDEARQAFETEKSQFPESAVFMDRLLANLNRP